MRTNQNRESTINPGIAGIEQGRRYLSKVETAQLFGVTPRCIQKWMANRLIPFYRVGHVVRFDEQVIRRHFDENFKVVAR